MGLFFVIWRHLIWCSSCASACDATTRCYSIQFVGPICIRLSFTRFVTTLSVDSKIYSPGALSPGIEPTGNEGTTFVAPGDVSRPPLRNAIRVVSGDDVAQKPSLKWDVSKVYIDDVGGVARACHDRKDSSLCRTPSYSCSCDPACIVSHGESDDYKWRLFREGKAKLRFINHRLAAWCILLRSLRLQKPKPKTNCTRIKL